MNARTRSYGFVLAGILLAGLVGWAGQTTWRQLHQLRLSFATVQSDSFHLSERLETSIRLLNESVLRFDLQPTSEARLLFDKEAQQLMRWLEIHNASVTSPPEQGLMRQIGAAFNVYLSRTTNRMEQWALRTDAPPKLVLEEVSENAKPILNLCQELSLAEHRAVDQFVKDSYRALGWLQRLFLVSLVLLMSFAGTLVLSLYRGTIVPLRVKLGQSRAIIERDEKLAALGTMAAGMAHEIRNPLTAVNVRLHSLTRTLLPGSSEQEDASVIGSELQRLDRILRQFLQFARPANPMLVTVSADYLLRKVQAILAPHLAKTAIRLEVESVPDSWVHVDPDQIEQVLVNLIKNAAESIGHDGSIILRAQTSTAQLGGRKSPAVILAVSDTGPGVPPEVQPRLFDPFFTTKESGTGLGLPIAARIVKQHGGILVCDTAPNRATTFSVVLPLAEKHEDEVSSDHPAR